MNGAVDRASSVAALLGDGQWCSGAHMARQLGVTRAAISARVRELRGMGLDIYSVAGRGYRLRAPLELLDAAAIRAALTPVQSACLHALDVHERLDSTNAALGRIADGKPRACLAEYQSAGRGRAARPWVSPFGANLYLSLAYDMRTPRAPLGALSLAVGLELADALSSLGAADIGLKWPNDLWVSERKLGGILIEHRGEVGGSARLIVGVGINVAMDAAQAQDIDQSWTRLIDHLPQPVARNRLAARMLGAVIDAAAGFEAAGFEAYRARWCRYDCVRDRAVRLIEAGRERHGIARGIAADGGLRVEIDGAIRAVYSGDVSLRVIA